MNGAHSDADAVAINIISIASSRDWGYAIFFPSNTTRRKRELAVSRAREFYMVIRESIANARAWLRSRRGGGLESAALRSAGWFER